VGRAAYAFLLSEALRPGASGTPPPPPPLDTVLFTTYHPLLVESHYSVLLCLFMLGDFAALLRVFIRAATVVDDLEGYAIRILALGKGMSSSSWPVSFPGPENARNGKLRSSLSSKKQNKYYLLRF